MFKTLGNNKIGLAILAVLIVIAAGVSVLAFNVIQAKRKDQTESELIDLIGLAHSGRLLLSMHEFAGPECDKAKASLSQDQQKLGEFLKAHPDAQAELEPYLIRTGLINNQQYMIQHGLARDVEAEQQQQQLEAERQAAASMFIPGFTPSRSFRTSSPLKRCQ